MKYKNAVKKVIEDINKVTGFEVALEYEWKSVVGFEGLYEVNETGIVNSLKRRVYREDKPSYIRKAKYLSTPLDKYGYKKVTLSKDGEKTYTTVHRLVALAFVPNPDNLSEVNHKDGDKLNNHWKNLEWCTTEYNLKHAHKNNLVDYNKNSGENCYITNLTNEIVIEIRKKMDNGVRNKDIEKEYNLSRSAVSRIKTKKSFKNIYNEIFIVFSRRIC